MSRTKISAGLAIAIVVVGTALAAVALHGGSQADKAGAETAPVTLDLVGLAPYLETEPAVAFFAKRVGELSGGTLRVRPVPPGPGNEAGVLGDVAHGRTDLGWIATRAFDRLGVKSFQALTAPLLIDSYPLERAVIASDIPGTMLEGLDRVGVTGLAVLGDSLSKPIAVKRPLLAPDDWRGTTFGLFHSSGQAAAVRALGATPREIGISRQGLRTGSVQGYETSLFFYGGSGFRGEADAPYVAANVNLWPLTVALFASPSTFSRLTKTQRAWLRQAASEAAARSTGMVEQEAKYVPAICAAGGRLANATPADLRALEQALAPVYSRLEQDSQTKAFIARIEELKRATPGGPALPIPAGCTGRAPSLVPPRGTTTGPPIPDGSYRKTVTPRELIGAGATPDDAAQNAGIHTITIRGHLWTDEIAGVPDTEQCANRIVYSGPRVWLTTDCNSSSSPLVLAGTWKLTGDSDRLYFLGLERNPDPSIALGFGGRPWRKIG